MGTNMNRRWNNTECQQVQNGASYFFGQMGILVYYKDQGYKSEFHQKCIDNKRAVLARCVGCSLARARGCLQDQTPYTDENGMIHNAIHVA